MDKINLILAKNVMYAIYALALVGLLGWFRGCSTSKDLTKMKKEVVELTKRVNTADSLLMNIDNKEDLNLKLEINGLEVSKRLLYDQNAIVRTKIRPDDAINEYDEKIEALQIELRNNQKDTK